MREVIDEPGSVPPPPKPQPVPMLWRVRKANYQAQNGCKRLTPAQRRRLSHKKNHRARKR